MTFQSSKGRPEADLGLHNRQKIDYAELTRTIGGQPSADGPGVGTELKSWLSMLVSLFFSPISRRLGLGVVRAKVGGPMRKIISITKVSCTYINITLLPSCEYGSS